MENTSTQKSNESSWKRQLEKQKRDRDFGQIAYDNSKARVQGLDSKINNIANSPVGKQTDVMLGKTGIRTQDIDNAVTGISAGLRSGPASDEEKQVAGAVVGKGAAMVFGGTAGAEVGDKAIKTIKLEKVILIINILWMIFIHLFMLLVIITIVSFLARPFQGIANIFSSEEKTTFQKIKSSDKELVDSVKNEVCDPNEPNENCKKYQEGKDF